MTPLKYSIYFVQYTVYLGIRSTLYLEVKLHHFCQLRTMGSFVLKSFYCLGAPKRDYCFENNGWVTVYCPETMSTVILIPDQLIYGILARVALACSHRSS